MTLVECRECGANLDYWNLTQGTHIQYCPECGKKVLKQQRDTLYERLTDHEIERMIKERLLHTLRNTDTRSLRVEELPDTAWEGENADGAVFYNNYTAARFIARHREWVDRGLQHLDEEYGDMRAVETCVFANGEAFLVRLFVEATAQFLFQSCGIQQGSGLLDSALRRKVISAVKSTSYSGRF